MALTFGTNRFGFPDPARLIQSCREAEAAGFDQSVENGRHVRQRAHSRAAYRARACRHFVGQLGHASSERDGGGHSYPLSIGVHGYG